MAHRSHHQRLDVVPALVVAQVTAAAPASEPIQVHNCSRVGLQANPPGIQLSLTKWFRRRGGQRSASRPRSAPTELANE